MDPDWIIWFEQIHLEHLEEYEYGEYTNNFEELFILLLMLY